MSAVYRLYSFNESILDSWGEGSAYFLGFAYAEGHLRYSLEPNEVHYCLEIGLGEKEPLETIRSILGANHPIHERVRKCWRTGTPVTEYRLLISSRYLTEQLIKIGFLDKDKFPEVPDEFLRHFVRGLIDGDGCLLKWHIINHEGEAPRAYDGIKLDIYGREHFLVELQKRLIATLNLAQRKVSKAPDKEIHRLIIIGQQAQQLFEWMYMDTQYYLSRKRNKYLDIMTQIKGE
mgnify:FL=1